MKIFPAVHYTMGGLWAGFVKDPKTGGLKFGEPNNMMTNVPGLYAMGEVSFAYHGANRLGANSLLSCIFDGLFGGTCIKNYITDVVKGSAGDLPECVYNHIVSQETDRQNWLVKNTGGENPYFLWQEMGKAMTDNCTVVRHNDRLRKDAGAVPGMEGPIQECAAFRHRHVDESESFIRPCLARHDRHGRSDSARRAASQRKPRRALQAGIPRSRRSEFPEGDHGRLRRGERFAEDRIPPGRHQPGRASGQNLRQGGSGGFRKSP